MKNKIAWIGVLALVLGAVPPASADAVNYDKLFSEPALGALDCAALSDDGKDGYHEKPVTVYAAPAPAARLPRLQWLDNFCIAGGGDCGCAVLYSARKDLGQAGSFYHVKTRDQRGVWVKAKRTAGASIKSLAGSPKNPSGNELLVRSEAYDDLRSKHRIKNIFELPEGWAAKIAAQQPVQIGYLKLDLTHPGADASVTVRSPVAAEPAASLRGEKELAALDEWESHRIKRLGLPLYAERAGEYLIGNFPLADVTQKPAAWIPYSADCALQSAAWVSLRDLPVEIAPLNSSDENSARLDYAIDYRGRQRHDGVEYTIFDVFVEYFDPGQVQVDVPQQLKTNRYLLRRIWVKTWKEDGTIGYWLNFVPC